MRSKPLLFALSSMVAASAVGMAVAAVAPAAAADKAVPQCINCGPTIVVSPHGGNAGSWPAAGGPVTLEWQVYNGGGSTVTVTLSASATKCAVTASPAVWPTSVTLAPDGGATVYTNVQAGCIGSGTAYLKAGQDQGYQFLSFTG